MRSIRNYAWIATLLLIVGACGGAVGELGTDPTTLTTTSTALPTTSTNLGQKGGEVPVEIVERATVDLATRLRVDQFEIEVISAEAVTWSDGSLGCPEPGKVYTQALVEGHRIILGHDERVYDYHSGGDRDPFLCPNPDSEDGGYDFVPPPGFNE